MAFEVEVSHAQVVGHLSSIVGELAYRLAVKTAQAEVLGNAIMKLESGETLITGPAVYTDDTDSQEQIHPEYQMTGEAEQEEDDVR